MLLIIIILIGILYFLYFFYLKKKELWTPYMELPYGDWKTAREPTAFYPLPRYREPYNFPARFKTNHPVTHCATNLTI
jgi:hypothetical protein